MNRISYSVVGLLLGLATVSACGETPIAPTRDESSWTTIIVAIPDFRNIADVCEHLGAQANATHSNEGGCNTFNRDTRVCTIYVHLPRYFEDYKRFEVMGHELEHCKFGKWHDE